MYQIQHISSQLIVMEELTGNKMEGDTYIFFGNKGSTRTELRIKYTDVQWYINNDGVKIDVWHGN